MGMHDITEQVISSLPAYESWSWWLRWNGFMSQLLKTEIRVDVIKQVLQILPDAERCSVKTWTNSTKASGEIRS